MDFDLKQKFFWFITRLKTSSIFRNLKVDAYPFNKFIKLVTNDNDNESSIEPCEQNPYQNAYYEAVYTLGRAIYFTTDQGTNADVFNATALLQHFTGPLDMWRYNNRASMTDTLRYERRKFIDRDLDVSLSVHQFYRAKVQLRGRIPKCYFLLLVEKPLKS